MSLDIDQIALHQLIKRDEQNLELVLRESLLEPNATVVEMMAELHRVYSAKSKAYGLFNEESELAQALRLQRQGEEEFLAFSRAATGRLRDELAQRLDQQRRDPAGGRRGLEDDRRPGGQRRGHGGAGRIGHAKPDMASNNAPLTRPPK